MIFLHAEPDLVISNLRHYVLLYAFLLAIAVAHTDGLCQALSAPMANVALASEIDALLLKEYIADDDSAEVSRVHQLFTEYDIPSEKVIGASAVEDFVVLLLNDQPLSFMKQVQPAFERAVSEGRLSKNDGRFFQARILQKTVEANLLAPTNPQLQQEIETLIKSDQAARGSDHFDPVKMQQTDEQNRAAIRSILDRYGVPTYAMVGSQAASDFVVMVQHQPGEFRQKALPKLKQNIDSGQGSARDYAMMYDRAQTDQGKPEIYGVNLICQPDGTLAPGPLFDPKHVEDRRAEIGLIPLSVYIRLAPEVAPPGFCKVTSVTSKK